MKGSQWMKIVLGLILASISLSVEAYYCGLAGKNRFIQSGDPMSVVQTKCGLPTRIEQCEKALSNSTQNQNNGFIQPSGFNNLYGQGTATIDQKSQSQTVTLTVYEYSQGPHLPSVFLGFVNGRLYAAPLGMSDHPCSSGKGLD